MYLTSIRGGGGEGVGGGGGGEGEGVARVAAHIHAFR